jgi:hypothetical protein
MWPSSWMKWHHSLQSHTCKWRATQTACDSASASESLQSSAATPTSDYLSAADSTSSTSQPPTLSTSLSATANYSYQAQAPSIVVVRREETSFWSGPLSNFDWSSRPSLQWGRMIVCGTRWFKAHLQRLRVKTLTDLASQSHFAVSQTAVWIDLDDLFVGSVFIGIVDFWLS